MIDLDELKRQVLTVLKPYGVRRMALFGSIARGEETLEGDVDLLVEFEDPLPRPLGLFEWVRLKAALSERLERKVELVSERALSPHIRPYVEDEKIVLYVQQDLPELERQIRHVLRDLDS